jgi:hypothetical protein
VIPIPHWVSPLVNIVLAVLVVAVLVAFYLAFGVWAPVALLCFCLAGWQLAVIVRGDSK